VTIAGEQLLGYQVWLGGDLTVDAIGRVAGRIAASDVVAITEASSECGKSCASAVRTLAATVNRFGLGPFQGADRRGVRGVAPPTPLFDPDADTRLPLVGVPA
jgi:hypothetical protein